MHHDTSLDVRKAKATKLTSFVGFERACTRLAARRVRAPQQLAAKRKRQLRSGGSLSPTAAPGSSGRRPRLGSAEPEEVNGGSSDEDEEDTSSSSSEEEAEVLQGKRRRTTVDYL